MKRSTHPDLVLFILYIVFFVSMVCSFRAVSSIATGLLLIVSLLKNKIDTGSWVNKNLKNPFLIACCLFYFVQLMMLLHAVHLNESVKDLQTKTAIFFIPLAVCSSNYLSLPVYQKIMKLYIWILAAVLCYCLLQASYRYCFRNAQADVFFYHELVSPFRQHAVQVSIILFTGFVYLLEKARQGLYFYSRNFNFLLIFYFTCCLLLLSSKLVIGCMACCFICYFFLFSKTKYHARRVAFAFLFACLGIIIVVLFTENKISRRFNEIMSGDVRLVEEQNFNPGIYFNGLQFRLLQWRFVKEILTEHHAWLTGVSDEAQPLLNKKYTSTHMYTGGVNGAGRGYLGYNTHNEFLESLLQAGIPGLLAFILVCYTMVQLAIRKRSSTLTILIILLIAYCFNESVLETQYGASIFTFFPLFIYYGLSEKKEAAVYNTNPLLK